MKDEKLFGREVQSDESSSPIELSEVSLVCSPKVLRSLSKFLGQCANDLEASPKSFAHSHFTEFEHANRGLVIEFVVVSPFEYFSAKKAP